MNSNISSNGKEHLILVADDNSDSLRLLQFNLEKEGFRVILAGNGQEALTYFKQFNPEIVLLDAVMPVMDGFETCRILRTMPAGKNVPILMITNLVDNDSVEKAFDYGVTDFIPKPIQWAILRHKIKGLLNENKPLVSGEPKTGAAKTPGNRRDLVGMTARLGSSVAEVPVQNRQLAEQLRLKRDLVQVVENNELFLHYQPQIDFVTGKMVAVEALVRWRHHDLGLIEPNRFIGLAEETGLIIKIGYWIMEKACRDCKAWQLKKYPPIKVAVNVSPNQLGEADFVERVIQILEVTGLEARYLELEITENIHLQNLGGTYATLNKLRAMGIEIAVDDFGTGYSSLSYLQFLPIDVLKIDASFVRTIGQNQPGNLNSEAILTAIVTLAQTLHLVVIAEGVENDPQLEILRKIGCQRVQGFFFSKPLPQERLDSFFFGQFATKSLAV